MLVPHNPNTIAAMQPDAIVLVRELETEAMKLPQAEIETTHTFHAGMYGRTIKIPAGMMITGALIKVPTLLIIAGDVVMFTDTGTTRVEGHNVFRAEANRKQAFVAETDTHLTMLFATNAITVEQAEAEFTDETHLLLTNRKGS